MVLAVAAVAVAVAVSVVPPTGELVGRAAAPDRCAV
jgi:hypothetical protein